MEKLVLVLDGMESDETEISREKVICAGCVSVLAGGGGLGAPHQDTASLQPFKLVYQELKPHRTIKVLISAFFTPLQFIWKGESVYLGLPNFNHSLIHENRDNISNGCTFQLPDENIKCRS